MVSWRCSMSNLFFIGIVVNGAVFVGFVVSFLSAFSTWV